MIKVITKTNFLKLMELADEHARTKRSCRLRKKTHANYFIEHFNDYAIDCEELNINFKDMQVVYTYRANIGGKYWITNYKVTSLSGRTTEKSVQTSYNTWISKLRIIGYIGELNNTRVVTNQ